MALLVMLAWTDCGVHAITLARVREMSATLLLVITSTVDLI